MVEQKLAEYVSKRRSSGDTDEDIRKDLINNRWQSESVDEALGVPVSPQKNDDVPSPHSSHLLSVGELFSVSFKMFKERFVSLLLVSLVPGLLVLATVIFYGIFFGATSVLADRLSAMVILIPISIIVFILILIVEMWGTVALMTSLCSPEKISFQDAYKRSWKNILSFFVINFLAGIIIFGGSILLIVPGIIFSVWFMFSTYVFLVDKEKGFRALMLSKEYAKGHWWTIVGRVLLVNLFVFGVFIVLQIISAILGIDSNSSPISLISMLINVGYTYFAMCYMYKLFENLRAVRGKVDLKVSTKSKVVFTLIGLVGILSIIVVPVIIIFSTINPVKQIEKAKSSSLENDRALISNAIMKYYAENNAIPNTLTELVPTYLKTIPTGTEKNSCYNVSINEDSGDLFISYAKTTEIVCNQISLE